MPTKENRKLAAILFADIQGYTATMQTDEVLGKIFLRTFHENINAKVEAHQGKVVNFYGDGGLCIFDSSVDAANCALELQQSFQTAQPPIPVRLGLHSGDVFFEADNAFGDSINITSRIESMGIPGSVLISERVARDIENQPELQPILLGDFEFKNVKRPLKVYALKAEHLIVPKIDQLGGKARPVLLQKKRSRILLESPLFGFLAFALLVSSVWYFKFKNNNPLTDLNSIEEIKEARIAVLPFENNTGNKDLDIVGDMASDWIIQGLMYLDDVHLVGYENIQENIKYAGVGDSSNTFAARTGAQKIVRGKYYLEGDQLSFQSRIIDAKTGLVNGTLPKIIGSKDNPSELVNELQQKFVTYFDAQNHDFSPGIAQNPPPHKAYKYFREGIDSYGVNYDQTREMMNNALQLDSSFFWPYIWITGAYFNEGKRTEADSVFALLSKNIDLVSLNNFDRQWYIHWRALLNRDLIKAYESIKIILDKDPKQWFSNVEAGIIANDLNRPKEAVEIFQHLNPAHAPQNIELDTWWHNYNAHNLFRVKQFEEAKKVVDFIQPKFRKHWNYYDRLAEIFAFQGKEDSLNNLILLMQQNQLPDQEILQLMVFIAERYGIQDQKEKQLEWAKKGIAWVKEKNRTLDDLTLGCLFYSAEQYEKAMSYFSSNKKDKDTWLPLSKLGCTYVKLENNNKATNIIKQLEDLYSTTNDPGFLMAQAHIYGNLGEKDKAVDLMKTAHQRGHSYTPSGYQNDIMFVPLHGYLPFEEFVTPKF